MNCQETRALAGPYLDSELDVATTSEAQRHLAACADCARWFATEAAATTRLDEALRHGEATPALWRKAAQSVRAAEGRPSTRLEHEQAPEAAAPWWRAWLWPNWQFYAGLAALWMVMLAVNLLTASGPAVAARREAPPSPETRQALVEQQRELAELLGRAEASSEAPGRRPESTRPPAQPWRGSQTFPPFNRLDNALPTKQA